MSENVLSLKESVNMLESSIKYIPNMNLDVFETKKIIDELASLIKDLQESINEKIEDMKENTIDNSSKNVKLFPFSIKRTH